MKGREEPESSVSSSTPEDESLPKGSMAVQLAQEALDGRTLAPADYAELVDLIYDALVNGLPSAQVLAFARPAARGIGLKGDSDANPVDQPDQGAAGARK